MDHDSFDRLARLLGRDGTRRTVLGIVFGTTVASAGSIAAKPARRRKRVGTQAASDPKTGLRDCPNPGPGQNLSKCNFAGQNLAGKNLRGANLSGALLAFADLCSVDLRGANLHKTDFRGAVLTRADLRGTSLSTANLTDAVLCRTRVPNGTLDDSQCPPDASDICCADADCDAGESCDRGACGVPPGGGQCVSLGTTCTLLFGNECCGYKTSSGSEPSCAYTTIPGVTTCQKPCGSDADCVAAIGSPDVFCAHGANCFFPWWKCCFRRHTDDPTTCASGKSCRFGNIEDRDFECCLPGESCDLITGCV
jgi:hypothetical protein